MLQIVGQVKVVPEGHRTHYALKSLVQITCDSQVNFQGRFKRPCCKPQLSFVWLWLEGALSPDSYLTLSIIFPIPSMIFSSICSYIYEYIYLKKHMTPFPPYIYHTFLHFSNMCFPSEYSPSPGSIHLAFIFLFTFLSFHFTIFCL